MKISSIPKIDIVFVFLSGVAVFVFLTGGAILDPVKIDWLMAGDPATHWLGWQFFRDAPIFQFPIGMNYSYGMELSSSLVFTDSIPLMALFFKPFNAFLPSEFQYFGIWILICFILQSVFSWVLLKQFTSDRLLPMFGSIYFLISPVLLYRLVGHYALFGQWVLIAAINLHFTKRNSPWLWFLLLYLTTMIHPYLLVMTGAIWLTSLFNRFWESECTLASISQQLIIGLVSTSLLMWAVGYFMLGSDVSDSGFGSLRMNLLSLVDSGANTNWNEWSRLLPVQAKGSGDSEGFNFLGSGMLGLGSVVVLKCVFSGGFKIPTKKVISLLILSVILFLYSISNNIAFGGYEVISYKLPSFVEPFTSAFRVSGRFFWPVYYCAMLIFLVLTFTHFKRNFSLAICVLFLAIQILDSFQIYVKFRDKFDSVKVYSSPMKSQIWNDFAKRYKMLLYTKPKNTPSNWMELSVFAAFHKQKINIGYFARTSKIREQVARDMMVATLINKDFNNDALYVFEDDVLWSIVINDKSSSDYIDIVDGFRILAPGWNNCAQCIPLVSTTDNAVKAQMSNTAPLKKLSFGSGSEDLKNQISGWSVAEADGTWANGEFATLLLQLPSTTENQEIKINISGYAFITTNTPSQIISVAVDNQFVQNFQFDSTNNSRDISILIPSDLLSKKNAVVLKLGFPDRKSPKELGLGSDDRKLAFKLSSLEISKVSKSSEKHRL